MKIIDKIRSFFKEIKTRRRNNRLQRMAIEIEAILSFGWTEPEIVTIGEGEKKRIGIQTEIYSKVKRGEVLMRLILEPADKKNAWLAGSRRNLLVHILFFPDIKLPDDEEESVKHALLEEAGYSFPKGWLGIKPVMEGYCSLDRELSKIQILLEKTLFFAILPKEIREITDTFEEETGIKLITYH